MPPELLPALLPDAIRPDWPASPQVRALMSTRQGGTSATPFDSLNLRPAVLGGDGMDDPAAVAQNQQRFAASLGLQPTWLQQVHGADVLSLDGAREAPGAPLARADASVCTVPGIACTVLVADCLPVLFCTADGRAVGAAHAGWRGLAGGVLDNTVRALCTRAGCPPGQVLAWLGPCIGQDAFEVGADVLLAFGADPQRLAPADAALFRVSPRPDGSPRWRADLVGLARRRLAALGVGGVWGGHWCTVAEPSRFFSFRRTPRTGRMAAGIGIAAG